MTLHESDRPAACWRGSMPSVWALEASGHGMALLGLGSVGLELERLDEYSDPDFFAIAEVGHKGRYIDNLIGWPPRRLPTFRNTADGYRCFTKTVSSASLSSSSRTNWRRFRLPPGASPAAPGF